MIKSIYTPLSGALAQEKALEIIANNLANISTVGFKGEKVSFELLGSENKSSNSERFLSNHLDTESFPEQVLGNEVSYVGVSGVNLDLSQGPTIATRNPLDIMIDGHGFLKINTPEGDRYTRSGALSMNEDGVLVSQQGYPVMGENGLLTLSSGTVEINPLGEVFQDGDFIDRLVVVDFPEPYALEKLGSNQYFYRGSEDQIKKIIHPEIKQGYLEGSNVNAIENLTKMILAHRSYEAYQKTIKNFDNMMDKSSNSIGKLEG